MNLPAKIMSFESLKN